MTNHQSRAKTVLKIDQFIQQTKPDFCERKSALAVCCQKSVTVRIWVTVLVVYKLHHFHITWT